MTRRAPDIDIVLLIDRITTAAELQARGRFAVELLHALAASSGELRAGIIAYSDRDPLQQPGWLQKPALQSWPLVPYRESEQLLTTLTPVPTEDYDFESALDEALLELRRLTWGASGLRVALTIGSRPPHPALARPEWGQLPSPLGHDWQVILADVRPWLHSYSVLCPIHWPADDLPVHAWAYAEQCWSQLGYSGCFAAESVDPRALAELISAG